MPETAAPATGAHDTAHAIGTGPDQVLEATRVAGVYRSTGERIGASRIQVSQLLRYCLARLRAGTEAGARA
jgi:hypothetical protein